MKKILIIIAAGLYMAACSWSEVIPPQGEYILTQQVQQTNDLVSSRADATFNGMYTKTGAPGSVFGGSRPDDFGFIMMAFSNDIEAADIVLANSGYNWFSACGMLTSRNADYANPYIRYAAPYNTIAAANEILASYSEDSEDESTIYKIAQARAMRAFAYLNLAPYFQFGYAAGAEDLPCIPIVTEKTTEFTDNPRATVAEVYELIISDLDYAIGNLDGYLRTDKSRIDIQTAYGLRARAYLNMQEWGKAAADAAKAAEGYSPATMDEAARPSFIDISEHSWIWGYDMTPDIAMFNPYASSSAWIRIISSTLM